jgi:hypothetical protein
MHDPIGGLKQGWILLCPPIGLSKLRIMDLNQYLGKMDTTTWIILIHEYQPLLGFWCIHALHYSDPSVCMCYALQIAYGLHNCHLHMGCIIIAYGLHNCHLHMHCHLHMGCIIIAYALHNELHMGCIIIAYALHNKLLLPIGSLNPACILVHQ